MREIRTLRSTWRGLETWRGIPRKARPIGVSPRPGKARRAAAPKSRASASAAPRCHVAPLAAVAIGGYGRRELAPGSDLDLLFLLPESIQPKAADAMAACVNAVVSGLWDLGSRVREGSSALSRPSRNQTGISNALHPRPYGLFLDDLPRGSIRPRTAYPRWLWITDTRGWR